MDPVTGALILSGIGSIGSALGGKSSSVSQSPQLTKQQYDAMDALLSYAKNGTFGTEGKSQFQTLVEKNLLDQMLQTPTMYNLAESEYKKILADEYNPYNEKGYYANYKNSALKELADASDNLNASLGASGKFFSTSRNRALSDLSTNYSNNLNNVLAQMYENNADKKINTLGSLVNLEGQKQGYNLNNINAGNAYNQQQTQNRLGAYGSVLGKNVNYGADTVSANANSPWVDVINKGIELGANALYNKAATNQTTGINWDNVVGKYGTNKLGLWY